MSFEINELGSAARLQLNSRELNRMPKPLIDLMNMPSQPLISHQPVRAQGLLIRPAGEAGQAAAGGPPMRSRGQIGGGLRAAHRVPGFSGPRHKAENRDGVGQ